jgi:hypothetical protein
VDSERERRRTGIGDYVAPVLAALLVALLFGWIALRGIDRARERPAPEQERPRPVLPQGVQ